METRKKKNLKTVIITIPDEARLSFIRRTSVFLTYFSSYQLNNFTVGENTINVNHTVYGMITRSYPKGATPFETTI